jgi:hypothetical protein
VAEAGDVAAVFRAGFDAAVDSVVDGFSEVVGDLAFERGAGLFR